MVGRPVLDTFYRFKNVLAPLRALLGGAFRAAIGGFPGAYWWFFRAYWWFFRVYGVFPGRYPQAGPSGRKYANGPHPAGRYWWFFRAQNPRLLCGFASKLNRSPITLRPAFTGVQSSSKPFFSRNSFTAGSMTRKRSSLKFARAVAEGSVAS